MFITTFLNRPNSPSVIPTTGRNLILIYYLAISYFVHWDTQSDNRSSILAGFSEGRSEHSHKTRYLTGTFLDQTHLTSFSNHNQQIIK